MSNHVRHGFVLLEAVVALAVVALAAAAAVDLFAASARAATGVPDRAAAVALAQHRLATLRLLEPAQLRHLPDSLARGQFAAPFAGFRWRADATASRAADLYDLRVVVTWERGSYTLVTRQFAPLRVAAGRRP